MSGSQALNEKPAGRSRRARAFIARIPFNAFLGLEILRAHPDGVTLRCKVRPDLLNSHGALHGGVTASLVDVAVGVAIQYRFRGARSISTVELKVSYFLPDHAAELCWRAHACFASDRRSAWAGST